MSSDIARARGKKDLAQHNLVSKLIDEVSNELDPELIEYLIEFFQNNILYSFDEDIVFKYKLVIDTNIVISNLITYYKRGNSLLHKIIKQPLLELYAPKDLLSELENKLPLICNKMKIDENVIKASLYNDIVPNIIIYEELDNEYYKHAHEILNERDNKDVPFLALSMELKSHGIISKDKDFEEQTEIKIWKLRESQKVITVINRGMLCLFIQTQSLQLILKTGYAMSMIILNVVYNITFNIVKYTETIFSTIGTSAKKVPLWVYTIFGLALIIILSDENNRKKGIKVITKIMNEISAILSSLFVSLKSYIVYMTPLLETVIEYSLVGNLVMIEKTAEMLEQVKMLDFKP